MFGEESSSQVKTHAFANLARNHLSIKYKYEGSPSKESPSSQSCKKPSHKCLCVKSQHRKPVII